VIIRNFQIKTFYDLNVQNSRIFPFADCRGYWTVNQK